MTTTFVAVIRPPKDDLDHLVEAVRILARATRTTFTWLFQKHRPEAEVKRTVCARFGILARHWSGCRAMSRAAAKSWREGGKELLATLATRLAGLQQRWPKDCLRPGRKRRNAVARRKAETAIARLSKDLEGDPRWCFGGRRLLRQGRLHDWRRRRDSEALFCGESTKTAGNEVAQWSASGNLKLRLPNTCARKYLILRNVRFSRARQSVIESAVEAARPVTWRVKLLRRGQVQLCATLEELEPAVASDAAGGAVGVDMNRSHLAVVDVSPEGRPTCARRVPLGCGSDAVWKAARAVVRRAAEAACPIILEHLDFRTKKAWLRSYGKRFAEVLSLFRSRQVRDAVEREARRRGVEVRYVDPAWTTRLGKLKYRRRCRLGTHHAAALVIGRRGLGFGERLPDDRPSLTRTVECVSTTGGSRTFVQRLPAAWLQGGRRRTGRRARAPGAPGAGPQVPRPDGSPPRDGSPAAVGRAECP